MHKVSRLSEGNTAVGIALILSKSFSNLSMQRKKKRIHEEEKKKDRKWKADS
jgi:hypothetical protein